MHAAPGLYVLWYFLCWLIGKWILIMVSEKEFRVIRNKVMSARTAFLHNISREKEGANPLVASAIDVEENGHLWMLVNSKMKNWENRDNIPLKLNFVPDDCHITLSGIGQIQRPEDIPPHLRDQTEKAKGVMKMKIFYGEYTALPGGNAGKEECIPSAGDLLKRISDNIRGRAYRRLLFFR